MITAALNGQLVLRGLPMFLFLVGEAQLGDRQGVGFVGALEAKKPAQLGERIGRILDA